MPGWEHYGSSRLRRPGLIPGLMGFSTRGAPPLATTASLAAAALLVGDKIVGVHPWCARRVHHVNAAAARDAADAAVGVAGMGVSGRELGVEWVSGGNHGGPPQGRVCGRAAIEGIACQHLHVGKPDQKKSTQYPTDLFHHKMHPCQ